MKNIEFYCILCKRLITRVRLSGYAQETDVTVGMCSRCTQEIVETLKRRRELIEEVLDMKLKELKGYYEKLMENREKESWGVGCEADDSMRTE